jgi:hypothetical protein
VENVRRLTIMIAPPYPKLAPAIWAGERPVKRCISCPRQEAPHTRSSGI